MTKAAKFTQEDVVRILKAFKKADCGVPIVQIDADGRITAKPMDPKTVTDSQPSPWDAELQD